MFSPPLNQGVRGSEAAVLGECWKPGAHPKVGKRLADSGAGLGNSDKVQAPFGLPVSLGDGVVWVCKASEAIKNHKGCEHRAIRSVL